MYVVEHTLETTAPTSRVWACCQDVESWPQWQNDLLWAQLDGPMSPGCSGRVKAKGRRTHSFRILDIKAGVELVWEVQGFLMKARIIQVLAPCDMGTRLTHRVEVSGIGAWIDPWFRRSQLVLSLPESARRLARFSAQNLKS
jgi:hypothetical protein